MKKKSRRRNKGKEEQDYDRDDIALLDHEPRSDLFAGVSPEIKRVYCLVILLLLVVVVLYCIQP